MNSNVALRVSFAFATLLIGLNGIPVDYNRRQGIDSVFGNYSSDKLVKCQKSLNLRYKELIVLQLS